MNKSNKYNIYLNYAILKPFSWRITIKKLNLVLAYVNKPLYGVNHVVINNFNPTKSCIIVNNFLIEPNLVTMLKSKDELTINLAFEILNNRINDRTG